MNKRDLEERLINFAVLIVEITKTMPATRAGNHLSGQLVRSGTSSALNYGEAQGGESRRDFIHKLKVVLKELRESYICLKIIYRAKLYKSEEKMKLAMNECNEINALPVASAGKDTTICANRCVQLGSAPVSGITYSWFDPDNTLSSTSVANPTSCPEAILTVYHLTVTDTAGCMSRDSVNVAMLLPLKAPAGPDVEICFGDSIQIGSALVEGQFYSWSPSTGLSSTTVPSPTAKPDSTTAYSLTVSDDYGCTPITDTITVTVHPLPDAKATDIYGKDTTKIILGGSIQLMATGGIQYLWWPDSALDFAAMANPIASPDSTTDYVATVTDVHGCKKGDTVRVDVTDSIVVWVPNAFTPDGDGDNDILYVRGASAGVFEFRIFDRWGALVFISRDPQVGWNGKNQSDEEEMPEGAYVFAYTATDVKGKAVELNGVVNLIR